MEDVTDIQDQLMQISNLVQTSCENHRKSALKVKKLYQSVDFDLFFKTFTSCIDCFLIDTTVSGNVYVHRLMEFVALVIYELKKDTVIDSENKDAEVKEHLLIEYFFNYILQRQALTNATVRVRSCQLINKVLNQLVEMELSDELCDKIEEALLERLYEPKIDIRIEAILSLHRFQNKTNPNDKIIEMFKSLMEHDRFAKIRKICLEKVCLREDVIKIVLLKIRDADVGVRLAAFTKLIKVPVYLKIQQRRLVLKCGILDTSDKIKKYVESVLLPTWFCCFHEDFHTLMKSVRLDASENDISETNKLCEFMLNILFKTKSLEELIKSVGINEQNKLIPHENLDWETVNYWRILVQFMRNHLDDEVERILPELTHFCKYIQGFCDNLPTVESTNDYLKNQFIIKQLFTISKGYDVADPVGRRALEAVVRYVLINVILTLDTVKVIVSNLAAIYPNQEHRVIYINEVISDITCPENNIEIRMKKELENDEKVRTLKNELAVTENSQQIAIVAKDYLQAETLEEKLKELKAELQSAQNEQDLARSSVIEKKRDIATLIKCLDIALGLLLLPDFKKMSSSLETLKSEMILDLLVHENATVQAKALHCYALFCVLDQKIAIHGIHLFCVPIGAFREGQECDVQILVTCISAIVDLLRLYGTNLIATPEESSQLSESLKEDHEKQFCGGTSLTEIIQAFVELMGEEEIELQEAAGRGLCSLLLSNVIQSSSLLSRLVLKWCDPEDESPKLKQLIGATLQELPKLESFHTQWGPAIIMTINTISRADDDSSLSEVSLEELAKFMVSLYQINVNDNEIILNFALKICMEIKKNTRTKNSQMLSKILLMLKPNDVCAIVDEILTVCELIRDKTNTREVSNNLLKFMTKLKTFNKSHWDVSKRGKNDEHEEEDEKEAVESGESESTVTRCATIKEEQECSDTC